jgi:hypothetical protein
MIASSGVPAIRKPRSRIGTPASALAAVVNSGVGMEASAGENP